MKHEVRRMSLAGRESASKLSTAGRAGAVLSKARHGSAGAVCCWRSVVLMPHLQLASATYAFAVFSSHSACPGFRVVSVAAG